MHWRGLQPVASPLYRTTGPGRVLVNAYRIRFAPQCNIRFLCRSDDRMEVQRQRAEIADAVDGHEIVVVLIGRVFRGA